MKKKLEASRSLPADDTRHLGWISVIVKAYPTHLFLFVHTPLRSKDKKPIVTCQTQTRRVWFLFLPLGIREDMADIVLSVVLGAALDKVAKLVAEKVGLLWGVGDDLKKLSNTLTRIQAVLEDAQERQTREERLRLWLRELQDVAYDIDDLLDELSFEALRLEIKGESAKREQVCMSFLSCFSSSHLLFRREMGHRIKEIRERLDEISNDQHALQLTESAGNGHWRIENMVMPQTSSLIDESDVFGREKDKEKLIRSLVLDDNLSGTNVSVISIVGMAGLGKTTLAQVVYKNHLIKNHFDLMAWVCVSQDFDVRRLTRAVIESATAKTPDVTELDPLQLALRETLHGKRFLIVLDDVWIETFSDWEVLLSPFRVGVKGSKIIITTQSEKVSTITGSIFSYHLDRLPDEDCWSLFKKCASVEQSFCEHACLEEVGKKIVKKCKGLPLAIKTIGCLLRFKTGVAEWDLILNSEIWDLPSNANKTLPALLLSYHHLPNPVKQCFAFCSIFPKEYGFEEDKLVQLWMAQGFIRPKGCKQLEEIGGEYFNELVLRSFFQYSHKNWEDQLVYKMHDLISNLAQYISGDVCFSMEKMESRFIFEKARHASLFCEFDRPMDFQALIRCTKLRTLLFLGATKSIPYITHPPITVPRDTFQVLRFVRVLDLSCASIVELPNSICTLKHLRYLDLSQACIKRLPDSITNLCYLQTLRLTNCSELMELPKGISNLINLRHLYMHSSVMNSTPRLISMPPRIGKITTLQRLSLFVVSKENGCGIGELKDMQHLRGSICISKLENVWCVEEALASRLRNKQYLNELELHWSPEKMQDDGVEEILRNLQPHVNIRMLRIFHYNGNRFPSWVSDPSFANLERVSLFNCRKCETMPSLGQLLSLKDLSVHGFDEVEEVGPQFCGNSYGNSFPLLETLSLEDMPNLKKWCGVKEGDFCCLKELEVVDCPKLDGFPYLPPTLTNLTVRNCKELSTLPRLPSLKNLDLNGCREEILSDVPQLVSLASLSISGFAMLKSLPKGLLQTLTNLRKLHIGDFSDLTSLSEGLCLQDLPLLEVLIVSRCPQLISFPAGLPITLRSFQISQLHSLKYLPKKLHCLAFLQYLQIWDCAQLSSFPEEGLPTTLRNLRILNCPVLKEHSQNEVGKDWSRIAHVPCIEIDGQQISPN